jgi:integrase
MAKVGHAVGLSYVDLGQGKFRLYWRQWEQQQNGTRKRQQRTVTVYSVEERKQLEVDIENAVRDRGWWEPAEVSARPADSNLEQIALEWVRWKVGPRGVAKNTQANLAGSMSRFFRGARATLKLRETDVVPASAMSIQLVTQVIGHWRSVMKHADSTIYQSSAAVKDMWGWAFDQERWPTLGRPPYNKDLVMPPAPVFEAPPDQPTLADCDACIARITHETAQRVAIIQRFTGLRQEQVIHIHKEDVDLKAATLFVRKGKSRREQALARTVPISPHLVAELSEWVAGAPNGPLFADKKMDEEGKAQPLVSYRNLTTYVLAGWKAATAEGLVREAVWAPKNRTANRVTHVFRAAFQGFLMSEGVSEGVIDWLVGHAARSTRGQHYASPGKAALKTAANVMPALWSSQ